MMKKCIWKSTKYKQDPYSIWIYKGCNNLLPIQVGLNLFKDIKAFRFCPYCGQAMEIEEND